MPSHNPDASSESESEYRHHEDVVDALEEGDKHFTTPLVGPPDATEHPAEVGQGEIEVSYETYTQRDPHIRIKHTIGGETDRYLFRVVDEIRHLCAPRQDFDEIPLPVLQAIYLCGYYMEAVDHNITHHALTELAKTIDYLNDCKQEHEDIPILHKRLDMIITRLEGMGCLLTDICLFSPEAYNSAFTYLQKVANKPPVLRDFAKNIRRYERIDTTPDFHELVDRPWADFNSELPELENDYCNTSQEYSSVSGRTFLDEHNLSQIYSPPTINNVSMQNVTAYDIAERKEIETTRIIDLDNGDILVNHISQTGVEHFYLSQNGEDEYVCETPTTRFIDPVVYEALYDDTGIIVTNIRSTTHIGEIIGLHDYSLAFTKTLAGFLHGKTTPPDDMESDISAVSVNLALMSVAPDKYRLANEKAVEIYENVFDYDKEVTELSPHPPSEEYTALGNTLSKLLPDEKIQEAINVMSEEINDEPDFDQMVL